MAKKQNVSVTRNVDDEILDFFTMSNLKQDRIDKYLEKELDFRVAYATFQQRGKSRSKEVLNNNFVHIPYLVDADGQFVSFTVGDRLGQYVPGEEGAARALQAGKDYFKVIKASVEEAVMTQASTLGTWQDQFRAQGREACADVMELYIDVFNSKKATFTTQITLFDVTGEDVDKDVTVLNTEEFYIKRDAPPTVLRKKSDGE
ncbi:hypothetical protein CMI37_32395 [Candidatus Pacearchaeota archaeon]|jgi:hypothetical protein|nr:hypothetical protein [Candidatus Pacearchaeota archaeon]|tara:strand:+ start:481 stop:1089 length:609 start_codon:yes stop_codon:yes gene_type:complete